MDGQATARANVRVGSTAAVRASSAPRPVYHKNQTCLRSL